MKLNMDNELEKRLRDIGIENIAFLIFIILIMLSYYANDREIDYFLTGNDESRVKYYNIMVFVFLVVVIISGYYAINSYGELMSVREEEYSRKRAYANLSFIASLATFIASTIFLYIAITDTEIDAEISL